LRAFFFEFFPIVTAVAALSSQVMGPYRGDEVGGQLDPKVPSMRVSIHWWGGRENRCTELLGGAF
jgi:hypothetical protein